MQQELLPAYGSRTSKFAWCHNLHQTSMPRSKSLSLPPSSNKRAVETSSEENKATVLALCAALDDD